MRRADPRPASAALLAGVFGAVTGARGTAPSTPILFAADHRPALDREIYRLDLNGKRLDLSRSPFEDTQPNISPDGQHVAFISERGHGTKVYVVGVDGRGLRAVSTALPTSAELDLGGWSPDGTRLAATAGTVAQTRLYVLQPGRRQRVVARVPSASASIGAASWSVDGRALAFPIFIFGPPIPIPRVRVVDEHGETCATFRARVFAWSPHGDRIASLEGRELTVREGYGCGPVILHVSPIAATGLFWVDARRLVLFRTDPLGRSTKRVGIEVPSGRTWKPTAEDVAVHLCACRSPDGSRTVRIAKLGGAFAIRVARVGGGGARTLPNVPGCMDDGGPGPGVQSLQFAAADSIVYQSRCPEPELDLYSVNANGSGLHALTRTTAEETQPALSPDGTRIAYVRADARGLSCKGCPSTIWETNADGTQLVFSRSLHERGPELLVVPAAGGAARDLKVAGSAPAWGPASIAYVGKGGLWRIAPGGTGAHRIARASAPIAAWSHAGTLASTNRRDAIRFSSLQGATCGSLSRSSSTPCARTAAVIRRLTTDASGWPGG